MAAAAATPLAHEKRPRAEDEEGLNNTPHVPKKHRASSQGDRNLWLYALGGQDGTNTVERCNPTTTTTTGKVVWKSAAPMLSVRQAGTAAVVNGQLYAIGGDGYLNTKERDERDKVSVCLNTMERYNVATNKWEHRAQMPVARMDFAAATLRGHIYALGGVNGRPSTAVDRYDPTTDTWKSVAHMSTPRARMAAVVVEDRLYALGGYGGFRPLNTVERYNPHTNTWEACAPMRTAQSLHAAAALNGHIYVVGSNGFTPTMERYDPTTNTWSSRCAPMKVARYALGAAVIDGHLYAVGGDKVHADASNDVERYDPATDSWETIQSMRTARGSHAVAAVPHP